MITNFTNLRDVREPSFGQLPALRSLLIQLEGQPYQFARIVYADELMLHFGELREYSSPKLKGKKRGSYVLTVRGSAWHLHSAPEACIISAGFPAPTNETSSRDKGYSHDLEKLTLITAGAHVVSTDILAFHRVVGIGLNLVMSDGSTFSIVPTPDEPPEVGDGNLLEIADWELLTPYARVLSVGPGLKWEYADAGAEDQAVGGQS